MTTNNESPLPLNDEAFDALTKSVTRMYDRFYEEMHDAVIASIDYAKVENEDDVDDIVDLIIDKLFNEIGVK